MKTKYFGYGYREKIEKEIERRRRKKLTTDELEEVLKPRTVKEYHSPLLKNKKRIYIYRNEIDEFVNIKVKGEIVKLGNWEIDDMIESLQEVSDDILDRERELRGVIYKIEDELGVDRGY